MATQTLSAKYFFQNGSFAFAEECRWACPLKLCRSLLSRAFSWIMLHASKVDKEEIKLNELVHDHAYLYDQSNQAYKDAGLHNNTWKSISEAMGWADMDGKWHCLLLLGVCFFQVQMTAILPGGTGTSDLQILFPCNRVHERKNWFA